MTPTGPHDVELEVAGPYKRSDDPPLAYWYRNKGHISFHMYANGPNGCMYYACKIPTRAPKPKKEKKS